MAMTFEEAMELLSGMFATLPRPVLSLVLESHSGNMERTVDYLITLSPQVCVRARSRARARARVCVCVSSFRLSVISACKSDASAWASRSLRRFRPPLGI
jgi:hypothetical protein